MYVHSKLANKAHSNAQRCLTLLRQRPCDHLFNVTRGGHAKDDLVRMEGLEPTHLTALEPKSSASTNSATFA